MKVEENFLFGLEFEERKNSRNTNQNSMERKDRFLPDHDFIHNAVEWKTISKHN